MVHSGSGKRPTMRMIAKIAGVSPMAVSLALRRHPKISEKTRLKIQGIAEKAGYRQDPQVSKLMHYLRGRRKTNFQSVIGALTTVPEEIKTPYFTEIINGVRQRAAALGFGFSLFRIGNPRAKGESLQRILRNRGVEGLVLLPAKDPVSLQKLLRWRDFSVVAATSSILAPDFHRIIPYQFLNMRLICDRLVERGYRRIGLVLPIGHELRVNHTFSSVIAWQNAYGKTEPVAPHRYDDLAAGEIRAWFKNEKPDVIIAIGEGECLAIARQLGLRVPGPIGFVSAGKQGNAILAGIDERAAEVGKIAVDLLSRMIQCGEKGIPALPTTTMVPGHWINGRSAKMKT